MTSVIALGAGIGPKSLAAKFSIHFPLKFGLPESAGTADQQQRRKATTVFNMSSFLQLTAL
jgi:hypothetical protein